MATILSGEYFGIKKLDIKINIRIVSPVREPEGGLAMARSNGLEHGTRTVVHTPACRGNGGYGAYLSQQPSRLLKPAPGARPGRTETPDE